MLLTVSQIFIYMRMFVCVCVCVYIQNSREERTEQKKKCKTAEECRFPLAEHGREHDSLIVQFNEEGPRRWGGAVSEDQKQAKNE